MRRIRSLWINIKYGVRNVFRWLPAIWKDRDYDHQYIYSLLYIKFKHMEKHLKSNNCMPYEGIERDIKDIIKAKELAYRLWQHDYSKETYPEELKQARERTKDLPLIDENGFWINHYTEEESKLSRQAMQDERNMIENDKNELFNLIRDKIENWWD